MGEFTENLLKLTEFPFSYSIIGLISLILGHGLDPQKLSFVQVGPLLILMGFVATTLSICDPVGAAQRKLLSSRHLQSYGGAKFHQFSQRISDSIYSISKIENKKDRDSDFQWFLDLVRLQAIKTKWISAEIDRITALVYFIIVVSLFISAAAFYYQSFLPKFSSLFGNNDMAEMVIVVFSIMALAAVLYMLIIRIYGSDGLQSKTFTVYKYLALREAVRRDREKDKFSEDVEKIEQYLNDNHWSLAKFWVDGTLFQFESP